MGIVIDLFTKKAIIYDIKTVDHSEIINKIIGIEYYKYNHLPKDSEYLKEALELIDRAC